MRKKILYISYDGMTDPLGRSQVLPYITGLADKGYDFTLLSCEKPDRYTTYKGQVEQITQKHNIRWVPMPFTTFPPILAKIKDMHLLRKEAKKLHRANNYDMVHCRSYVSADIGSELKNTSGTKFFFDMRGFWVDERIEGNIWNVKNPIFNYLYKHYKRKESTYISNADQIISLTQAARTEIKRWSCYRQNPIQVIPCSADFELFRLRTVQEKAFAKTRLNIDGSRLVISYLGSIGTWYLLDEMLRFFKFTLEKYTDAMMLFITPEPAAKILDKAKLLGIAEDRFIIRSAVREEVPALLAASDISLSFIKPSYSKIASSPTKLGELYAMGIPAICNGNVGDVEYIVKSIQGTKVVDISSDEGLKEAVEQIPALLRIAPEQIRNKALDYYDLKVAVEKYHEAYKAVLLR